MEEKRQRLDPAPVLIKWAIKYDSIYNMPEYAQGTFIGTGSDHTLPLKNGEFVRIHDVEVFDMLNKVLKTSNGQKFYLSGSGQRIFMVDNDEVVKFQMEKMREEDPENID